jgi:hypothetical protein
VEGGFRPGDAPGAPPRWQAPFPPVRPGRPTLLRSDVLQVLLQALQQGNTIDAAAAFAGIHRRTFYDWMKRGREDDRADRETEHALFLHKVEQALSGAEMAFAGVVTKAAAAGDAGQAWRWLQARRGRRWNPATRVAVGGDGDDRPVVLRLNIPKPLAVQEAEAAAADAGAPVATASSGADDGDLGDCGTKLGGGD